ncbi:DUF3540 domain-containing protein [Chondromyces apiculatus]|uniref:DUF3540 domain-containing protein n=1 Tax=Chondromyces apiculatus DSM 436 TaxID=1192034 RepID=A0A017TJP3_9BACT|nr:DUF3540 domain-containing protein [Chondromyces apiculatus]EYF08876.1 Hypothetical protein CAP_2737 [Chondromyces apiculatus DSM 436]
MSNIAVLRTERVEKRWEYLGPADVVAAHPHALDIRMPSGVEARARLALAFPYEAVPGDVVLAIGNPDGCYVIGVLSGQGRTVLELHGDVDLRAVSGSLNLSADKGVRIAAPEVELHTGKLRLVADTVMQKFTSLRQRVTDLLSVHAGQSHSVVDGASFSQSKSATLQTQEKVLINGKEIHLG